MNQFQNLDSEQLLSLISLKREEMISSAAETGLTSNETVKQSQELDLLLNHYQQLKMGKQNSNCFKVFIKESLLFINGRNYFVSN